MSQTTEQQPQYPQSSDSRWFWNGNQWVPMPLLRHPWKFTPWRVAWLVWCLLWGVIWLLLFWPMAGLSFAAIALIAIPYHPPVRKQLP